MAQQIILTDEEKTIIEKQLKKQLNPFFMTDEERETIDKVIDDANALMEELDAYDELDGDLIAWYYNKYKEQNITQ